MNKQQKLQEIAQEIAQCRECQKDKVGKAVAGEGNADADVVFLGEAPGKQEAATGRPPIGRSGKFLRALIREVGLQEEDVYITSPVKYLPKRGTPSKSDIAHGRVHLMKQLGIIQPKIVVLLGKVAAYALLNEEIPVLKEHGKRIERKGISYFLTLHPAAAIRFQKFKSVITGDFQRLKKIISPA